MIGNRCNLPLVFLFLGMTLTASSQVEVVTPKAKEIVQAPEEQVDPADKVYTYTTASNDPTKTRVYTLDNGLTVYLSANDDEPRIQTYVAVRAGSKNDPAQTTGLAHYLEHMLFKGTNEFGTQNYKLEKPQLDAISKLYEQHRAAGNAEEKATIYAEIDRLSNEAAKLAIPNEYDKMVSAMGAKGTNAWTSFEQTVYTNDIPSTELERWAYIESRRFQNLVLRLFHTELEAVYEEFNMSQDRDGSKMWKALMYGMFPDHPYGTQTTIGEGEHLKNPSLKNIEEYFNRYYVPANMAICMAGDLDPDETIRLLDRYFGSWDVKETLPWKVPGSGVTEAVVRSNVYGLESESLMMGFRFPGANPIDMATARMVDGLLQNGQAGLIDLNLVQQQKVLSASTSVMDLHDYSAHIFSAKPREGQSLEEVESLLLAEIDKLRRGDFPDWMLQAVINDQQLQLTRTMESNRGRAGAYVDAFTLGMTWEEYLNQYSYLRRIKKSMVQDFVRKYYGPYYTVVYKLQGEDSKVVKVDKPKITPVSANRDEVSPFVEQFLKRKVSRETPVFVDFKRSIQDSKLKNKVEFSSIKNSTNDLFQLYYILDMGRDNDPMLSMAVDYLPFLGTDTCSASELAQAFFRLGVEFSVSSNRDRVYVSLSGLQENFESGVALFEYVLQHVKPDQKAWDDMVDGIIKERENAKTQKSVILWQAMYDYARFGENSPFKNRYSELELRNMKPADLTDRIKGILGFEHHIFYYGPKSSSQIISILDRLHVVPEKRAPIPAPVAFNELNTDQNKVYFVNYDMVQAQVVFMSRAHSFDKSLMPMADLFNAYFGSGLSSIVFQEIRETRALAYSAFASFSSPAKPDESHYLRAFVGTQADKMPEAISAMYVLLQGMPEAEQQFQASKESVLKRIESDRITKASMYWNRDQNQRRGIKYDYREAIYNAVNEADMGDLRKFFQSEIANKPFTYLVLGDRSKIDLDMLKGLGEFRELSLEEIFGY